MSDKAICYGRSVPSIGEQLYGKDTSLTEQERTKKAQKVYDDVMARFPNLKKLMAQTQKRAKELGYTETILGRRRHHPDLRIPEFEFVPLKGYVNPDVDPLDPETLKNKDQIPQRIQKKLLEEFQGYKYFGQIARRTKELYNQDHIKVINHRAEINDATRAVVNAVIQGSAADMSKMALLKIENNEEWADFGGRLVNVIHDEVLGEVPMPYAKEGGEVLSKCMKEAGSFLPFKINCDVETTMRWYGVEYPCPYKKPEHFDSSDLSSLDSEEVKWIQYHLIDLEYTLPVFKDENGNKPIGDAALGINGVVTDELKSAIDSYKTKYKLKDDKFIDHLYQKCEFGRVDNKIS